MRTYELMAIFRPELAEPDVRAEVERVEKALTDRGAGAVETDFWGKKRFAYEIDNLKEGYYAVQTFQAEPNSVEDVDRALAVSDNVIRHKFVRPE